MRDAQVEHDLDPNDFCDAHIALEDRRYFVDAQDRRWAYCRYCGYVICGCHEEAPAAMRRYGPAQHARPEEP